MDVSKRKEFFRFIRDIPYKIALLEDEQDYCCSTKSTMLSALFEKNGLETRQIICKFDWRDTPLPPDILSLPYNPDDTTHQYFQVFIPETSKWVNCDPTWDVGLKSLGFKVAEWDGLSDTELAVNPTHIYSASESSNMINGIFQDRALISAHMDFHRDYYYAINRWMASGRL